VQQNSAENRIAEKGINVRARMIYLSFFPELLLRSRSKTGSPRARQPSKSVNPLKDP
jgi:hypothetical protein